jgi:hypothetical protein
VGATGLESPATSGQFLGIQSDYTSLTGHNTALPGTSTTFGEAATAETILTQMPFYKPYVAHWTIRGMGNRWGLDGYGGITQDTVHKVWIRGSLPN